ncbi:MAG: hypothetical protein ACE5JM_00150 [Armatimonadota bacterium]
MGANDAIVHQNVPIIEVTDPGTLDLLFADPSTAVFLLRRLSERVAVVEPTQFDALLARLRKLGHLPKVME